MRTETTIISGSTFCRARALVEQNHVSLESKYFHTCVQERDDRARVRALRSRKKTKALRVRVKIVRVREQACARKRYEGRKVLYFVNHVPLSNTFDANL